MNIGKTIRDLRKQIKPEISQDEMAKRCGITQTSLSQIERNVCQPHPSTTHNICKALGITVPMLYIMSITQDDIAPSKKQLAHGLESAKNLLLIYLEP